MYVAEEMKNRFKRVNRMELEKDRIWYCPCCKRIWRDDKLGPFNRELKPIKNCPLCGNKEYSSLSIRDITDITDSGNPYLFRLRNKFLEAEGKQKKKDKKTANRMTTAVYRVECDEDGRVLLKRGKGQWGPYSITDPLLATKIAHDVESNLTKQLKIHGYPQKPLSERDLSEL